MSMADHTGEPALTLELIGEELARVEDESENLARSSVDMLAPLLASSAPDEWVEFRVDQVRDAFMQYGISTYERDEIVGVLESSPRKLDSLDRLRALLERIYSAPYPLLDRASFDARVAFVVRAFLRPDQIVPALEKTSRMLRAQLDAAYSVLSPKAKREMLADAWAALASPRTRKPRTPPRTAADLAPPIERARISQMASDLADSVDDGSEIALLTAMHELVITGCRAIALHHTRTDPSIECPRLMELPPPDEAREMRFAANHPAAAISNALGVMLLVQNGPGKAALRARRWARFGDAPLHVLELVTSAGE
jgi:hypothetical protein